MSLLSLNLLPPEDCVRIQHENLSRFLMVSYSFFALLLATGAILLLPTYFFLFFQYRGAADQVSVAEHNATSEQSLEIESRVKKTNEKLRQLATEHTLAASPVTQYLQDIAMRMPLTITLTSFSYEQKANTILLQGNATTRADLLVFIDKLRDHPDFSNIESPVTNILKERDVSFNLSFSTRAAEKIKP